MPRAKMSPEEVRERERARHRKYYAATRAATLVKHREYYRTHAADWKRRSDVCASGSRYDKKHRERHPDKAKCRALFKYAVRKGAIIRQPCNVCGVSESEGHHKDYSKPFDVQWLCRKHHMEQHRINVASLA